MTLDFLPDAAAELYEAVQFYESREVAMIHEPQTMNRIDQMFQRKRAGGGKAMIFYVTAGYPDLAATEETIDALAEAGADLIELGIPFSDPIADGPTIQQASYVALQNGVTLRQIFALALRLRAKHPGLPILLFTAYNPIFHLGEAAFVRESQVAGIDGLLVPDLPPEEGQTLQTLCVEAGLALVYLVAPTTTPARAKKIAAATTGFVYCIALKGVTGARTGLPAELKGQIRGLRKLTDKPLAVGFGVSEPDQARAIAGFADGVIIGSQLVKLIGETPGDPGRRARIRDYARSMVAAARPD
jgi:tryptophan synthase alpha chain